MSNGRQYINPRQDRIGSITVSPFLMGLSFRSHVFGDDVLENRSTRKNRPLPVLDSILCSSQHSVRCYDGEDVALKLG